MQNLSRLSDYLEEISEPLPPEFRLYPALYADKIFRLTSTIIGPYRSNDPELQRINQLLSSIRIAIEHLFAHHKNIFRLFQAREQLRLYGEQGVAAAKLIVVSFFILNCYTCLRGNVAGTTRIRQEDDGDDDEEEQNNNLLDRFFHCSPPYIGEYCGEHETLPGAPDVVVPPSGQYEYGAGSTDCQKYINTITTVLDDK